MYSVLVRLAACDQVQTLNSLISILLPPEVFIEVRAYIVRACVINILVGIRASTLSKQTNKQTPINHHT